MPRAVLTDHSIEASVMRLAEVLAVVFTASVAHRMEQLQDRPFEELRRLDAKPLDEFEGRATLENIDCLDEALQGCLIGHQCWGHGPVARRTALHPSALLGSLDPTLEAGRVHQVRLDDDVRAVREKLPTDGRDDHVPALGTVDRSCLSQILDRPVSAALCGRVTALQSLR